METSPIIILGIDRSVLEAAVPAAKSKNDGIYNALLPYLRFNASRLCWRMLGSNVCQKILDGELEELRTTAAWVACIETFCDNIRSLDVVLTNTGFGVVSTQDTAPASTARVDALLASLEVMALELRDNILDEIVKTDDWDGDANDYFPTVFYKFEFLKKFASKRKPTADDWWGAIPYINEADQQFRDLLGDDQVNLLVCHLETSATTKEEDKAILLMRRLTGQYILGNGSGHMVTHQLLDYVERHIDAFQYYAESEEYQARHYEGYANTQESPLYVFQG